MNFYDEPWTNERQSYRYRSPRKLLSVRRRVGITIPRIRRKKNRKDSRGRRSGRRKIAARLFILCLGVFTAEVTRERPANPLERLIRGETTVRFSTVSWRVGCFRIDCTDDSWGSLHRWPPPQYSKPTRPTPWLEAYPYAEKRRDTARRNSIFRGDTDRQDEGHWVGFGSLQFR